MVSLGSIEAAIDCGLVCLRESGIHIDMPISDEERDIHMNAAKRMMEKADVDQLMEVKKLQDPNIASIVELLTTLSNIAYMVDRNFHAWLLSKAVLLSFEHGFSPMSLWSIALFAGVCIGDQAPTLAYNIGNAAAALCRAYRGEMTRPFAQEECIQIDMCQLPYHPFSQCGYRQGFPSPCTRQYPPTGAFPWLHAFSSRVLYGCIKSRANLVQLAVGRRICPLHSRPLLLGLMYKVSSWGPYLYERR